MFFYDLPGIGESEEADARYLQKYREILESSDVVLWAIHADNRSVMFDLEALNKLMIDQTTEQKAQLMSKLTFVLTKADVLQPPAWMMLTFGNFVKFLPGKSTASVLAQKADYYQNTFLKPYGNLIVSKTYNDCQFQLTEEGFSYNEYLVFYNGYMNGEKLKYYQQKYPKYAAVFERIHQNYEVIPCSALFKFNLNKLMLVIINKLGQEATIKFKSFMSDESFDQVSLEQAKQFCNLIVFDPKRNKKLFDFSEIKF